MSEARHIVGDALSELGKLPAGSVDLILTSPPFLALRSYLPDAHPDKAREVGQEGSPAGYIDALLEITAACGRVLAPHGSLVIELGDTYAGSGGAGGDYGDEGIRAGQPAFRGSQSASQGVWGDGRPKDGQFGTRGAGPGTRKVADASSGWPEAKSLTMIPELFRVALAYGMNPLTGVESPAGRWKVRNVVRWCRPNPPVGSVGGGPPNGDYRYRNATSDLVVACRGTYRYMDLDAVRVTSGPGGNPTRSSTMNRDAPGYHTGDDADLEVKDNPGGRPPYDWWVVSPGTYQGSHYATWPEELLKIPVASLCPRRVCVECGRPSDRIVEPSERAKARTAARAGKSWTGPDGQLTGRGMVGTDEWDFGSERVTVGWSDCGHDSWRRGVVLDPFSGTGTTGVVATGHGLDYIGIDLDSTNVTLARERLGMFLTVDGEVVG